MIRTVIIYNKMICAFTKHLMNYFGTTDQNPGFDVKLLTQYVYKQIEIV